MLMPSKINNPIGAGYINLRDTSNYSDSAGILVRCLFYSVNIEAPRGAPEIEVVMN